MKNVLFGTEGYITENDNLVYLAICLPIIQLETEGPLSLAVGSEARALVARVARERGCSRSAAHVRRCGAQHLSGWE